MMQIFEDGEYYYFSIETGPVLIMVISSLAKLCRDREASRAEMTPAAPGNTKNDSDSDLVSREDDI